MDEEQEDEEPFEEGDYVLVVNEPDSENLFGTVTQRINEHEFVITDANGNETNANDEIMLHAEEGDICWFTWLIPIGSCLVNLDPVDTYYTTGQHDHIDFNMLADKLFVALTKKFKETDFTVTPIRHADTAGKTHIVINNSSVSDQKISEVVASFLSRTSKMKDIWYTDDDPDQTDEEIDAEVDELIRQIEEEDADADDEDNSDE